MSIKLPESTTEKSELLAQAMGDGWLLVEETDEGTQEAFEPFGVNMLFRVGGTYAAHVIDLYAPENMALAWRVLNWALDRVDDEALYDCPHCGQAIVGRGWARKLENEFHRILWLANPAEAQAAWLDKILELAIDAGLVEIEERQ